MDERKEEIVAFNDEEIDKCFDFNFKDELKGVELEKDDNAYSFKKRDARLFFKKDGEHYKSLKTLMIRKK